MGWLRLVGLFCRISSPLQGSFAEETYNFKEPTNCSHPISKNPILLYRYACMFTCVCVCVCVCACTVRINGCWYPAMYIHVHTHAHTHNTHAHTHTHARRQGIFNSCANALLIHCNTLQHTATHCNTLQHTATHCNTLQHTPVPSYTALRAKRGLITGLTLQHVATRCITLQLTSTKCNPLQLNATGCNVYLRLLTEGCFQDPSSNKLQRTTSHCITLQFTATGCTTLQQAATHCNRQQHTPSPIDRGLLPGPMLTNTWGRVVTMTHVFHDVTVSHSGCDRWGCPLHCCLVFLHQFLQVLQCVAVRCGVLQCVALSCSEL